METVKVLGTTYKIKISKQEDIQRVMESSDKYYAITDFEKKEIMIDESLESKQYKETLRHELVHVFFYESGLDTQSEYARNEELIDWIALQYPKIKKTFEDIGVE